MTTLLQEYVQLLIERIRTKKNSTGGHGEKFDIRKFKALQNEHEMVQYADAFLERLGKGSSRVAFLLSGKYALKIALNDKGLAQNGAEVDVYTSPKSKPVVAKIYASDQNDRWVIADLVKPLTTVDEFKQLSGIGWEEFCKFVNVGIKEKKTPTDAPPFVKAVISTAVSNGLLRGDIAQQDFSIDPKSDSLTHWGKTPDGRVVLLDYGFTGEVWDSHYSSKPTHDEKTKQHGNAVPGHTPPEELRTKQDGHLRGKTTPIGSSDAAERRKSAVDPYAKTQRASGDEAPNTVDHRKRSKSAHDDEKTRR